MAAVKIEYVTKNADHHEAITHVGGALNGRIEKWTKAQAIKAIEDKIQTFYTESRGKRADVKIREGKNGKYLQTQADGVWSNNLLALPDFPTTTSTWR